MEKQVPGAWTVRGEALEPIAVTQPADPAAQFALAAMNVWGSPDYLARWADGARMVPALAAQSGALAYQQYLNRVANGVLAGLPTL